MLYVFKLNLENPVVRRELGDVHMMHARIREWFEGAQRRLLWRSDPTNGLLIVRGGSLATVPTGDYILSMEMNKGRTKFEGDVKFALKANPTKTNGTQDGSNGQRVPVDPMKWLERKAGLCGFAISTLDKVKTGYVYGVRGGTMLTFFAADYAGKLNVTDAELFSQSIRAGIGPAKGYGFGLMICH